MPRLIDKLEAQAEAVREKKEEKDGEEKKEKKSDTVSLRTKRNRK